MSSGEPPNADADFVHQCREWLGELLTLVMELALECHPYEKSVSFRDYASSIRQQMPRYQQNGTAADHRFTNMVLNLNELTTLLDSYISVLDRVIQETEDTGEAADAFLQTLRTGRRLHLQMNSHLRTMLG